MIDLSIVPLYKCNMNCCFCYLGNKKQDDTILDLNVLERTLSDERHIRDLDIYGGEISLLDDDYIEKLMEIVGRRHVSLVTNSVGFISSKWKNYMKYDYVDVSFSYDSIRENSNKIKNNIINFDKFNKPYSVICVDVSDLDYDFLMLCKNLKSISIKPYVKSIYNKTEYDLHMQKIYTTLHDKYLPLFDKIEIVSDYRDSTDHLFLLPDGKLYDIRYDDGYEYFCNIEECDKTLDSQCLCCKYYKRCFNEHYFEYEPTYDCIGRIKTMEYLDGIYNIH